MVLLLLFDIFLGGFVKIVMGEKEIKDKLKVKEYLELFLLKII